MPDFLAREDDLIFDLDLRKHFLTDLQLYGVKIIEIDLGERKFSVEPGNLYPSIVVEVSNVTVLSHVTGGLKFGPMEMFNFTEFEIRGLEARFTLGVVQDKNNTAFWQVRGGAEMSIAKLRIHTDNPAFTGMIDILHKFVMMFIASEEHGLQNWVEKIIADYNLLLRTRASFLLPWPEQKAYHLNATIVAPPQFDADS